MGTGSVFETYPQLLQGAFQRFAPPLAQEVTAVPAAVVVGGAAPPAEVVGGAAPAAEVVGGAAPAADAGEGGSQAQNNLSAKSAIALSDATKRISFSELHAAVSQHSTALKAAGVGPETLVATLNEPSVDAIVSILSVLQTGAAYLPLDISHGKQRVAQVIEQVAPDFTYSNFEITHNKTASNSNEMAASTAGPSPKNHVETAAVSTNQNNAANPENLGYVISTSGSTGLPKAAMLEQRGLANHTLAMIELLQLDENAVLLQTAPPSFDISVWQCTTPIIAGARTHVATQAQRMDPRLLWQVIVEEQITVTQLVPSMIRLMLDRPVAREKLCLKSVITTGEAIDPALVNRWFDTYPDLELINLYGPAECSDDVSVHRITGPVKETEPVPIGKAFANAQLVVIDPDTKKPIGAGETGELQVRGLVVGRGYRNDAKRTDEVFSQVADINDATKTVRAYNTGDLVYEDPNGLLRYVGRKDFQVKVRGNRVELGEIEAVINTSPNVRACVVTKLDDGTDRLIAHIEAQNLSETAQIDRVAIRDLVAAKLPKYMCPSAVTCYDRLPLTPNGKTDRKALREPSQNDVIMAVGSAKRASTPTEKLLQNSWSKLLGIDEVPIDVDFYDLGGTSLLAVICIDDLENDHQLHITPAMLIQAGNIENLAQQIDAQNHKSEHRSTGSFSFGNRLSTSSDSAAHHRTGIVTMARAKAVKTPPSQAGSQAGASQATVSQTLSSQLSATQGSSLPAPFFIYPGEAVSALGMVELGRRIEPVRNVHVFEPARPLEGEAGADMKELARRCIEAIKTVETLENGVHLGGFCMGGDVAWEIATQLENSGIKVHSVQLLQTEREGHYPKWPEETTELKRLWGLAKQRARFERQTLKNLGRAQAKSHFKHLIIGKVISKFTLPIEEKLDKSGWRKRLGLNRSLRLKQHLWAEIDRRAYNDWEPQPINAHASIFRATEQPQGALQDDYLGWAELSRSSTTSHEISGFHWSFLHLPAVVPLAKAVSESLQKLENTTTHKLQATETKSSKSNE